MFKKNDSVVVVKTNDAYFGVPGKIIGNVRWENKGLSRSFNKHTEMLEIEFHDGAKGYYYPEELQDLVENIIEWK